MRPRPVVCADGAYEIDDGGLPVGSTLGGGGLTVKLLANGSIDTIHWLETGSNLVRDVDVHHFDARTGLRLMRGAGRFTLRPDRQVHRYALSGDVEIEKTTLVLCDAAAPAVCYVALRARNDAAHAVCLDSIAVVRIKSAFDDEVGARWDRFAGALVVWSGDARENGRLVRSSERPASRAVTGDHARMLENRWRGPFDETIDAGSIDPLAVFHVRTTVEPRAAREFWFAIAPLPAGSDDARATGRRIPGFDRAVAATASRYEERLGRTVMLSPVRDVDLGVRWAKANMLRVMGDAPTGPGFTNDPGKSTSCVGRDAAWFVHGCDWLDPSFSESLLRSFAARQEADGKIVEFFDLRTGATSDDGLNVNDNTPLFALAVWHHVVATGNSGFLEELYPAARRAVEQLLANRDERGLVFCTADGTGARGIVGWRNIIGDYRLSGATTELNCEAAAALRKVGALATALGRPDDAERYARAARTLHDAIDRHLRNPDNGLYYLNIDVDGRVRTALSADLIFPVIFGIADDATSARIVQRLREADFWTEAGVRTVPRDAPEYGPVRGNGLLGGVWAGVTVWYAFAAARFVPDLMVEALQKSFAHFARDPSATNTVPGEFSEWLHGDTLVNEGMMLSPWFPPRYLWAAIEGACGLEPTEGGVRIAPRLPGNWAWLAARNIPVKGSQLTWLVVRMDERRLFTTGAVESRLPTDVYERDVTDQVSVEGEEIAVAAFAREGMVLLFIGNRAPHTTSVAVRRSGALARLEPQRRYESLDGTWTSDLGEDDVRYTTMIGRGGFTLIEFT